jgi:hypothetical protein
MLRRSGRVAALTAAVAFSALALGGVAHAADGDYIDEGNERHGGVGGAAGDNSAECQMGIGPGSKVRQCGKHSGQRGSNGPDHVDYRPTL